MASYAKGRNKTKTRDSVLVRGFWGDIVNSPFLSFGNEVFKEPERTRFYRQVNMQSVYSNCDISEYNVLSYITKLEDLVEYNYPFERLKHVMGSKNYSKMQGEEGMTEE
jgi:dynein assembly factor 3